jgi:hypothetical protein
MLNYSRIVRGWRWELIEKGYDAAVVADELGIAKESVYGWVREVAGSRGMTVGQLLEVDREIKRRYRRAGDDERRLDGRGSRAPGSLGRLLHQAVCRDYHARLRSQYLEQRSVWLAGGNEGAFVSLREWRKAGPMQYVPRARGVFAGDVGWK